MAALRTVSLALASVAVLLVAAMAAEVVGHSVRPERRDVTEERIRQLQLPSADDANSVIYRAAYSTPPR
jgi:hypothetical protein